MFAVPEATLIELGDMRGPQGRGTAEDCISRLRALQLPDTWWMYQFKVTPCTRSYSHKWTLCPCAHAGETARRRDPRTHPYKAVLCPLAKMKKVCPMGDACMFAHHVFEHWLHPSRFKTRLCSFGRSCNRPICFFAHDASELRAAPAVDDASDLDEREYLMQLMATQHATSVGMAMGMPGAMHGQAHMCGPMQDMDMSNGGGFEGINMVGMLGSGRGGMQRQHSAQLGAGKPNRHMGPPARAASARDVRDMSAAVAAAAAAGLRPRGGAMPNGASQGRRPAPPPPPPQPGPHGPTAGGLDAASLLMGLQESLASIGGLAVEGGWSAMPGAVGLPPGAQSRISDPGAGAGGQLDPMRQHLTRMSDSGQVLGLGSANDIAGLESLLSSALAGAISHPGTSASSPLSATSRAASMPLSHSTSGALLAHNVPATAASSSGNNTAGPSVSSSSPPPAGGGPGASNAVSAMAAAAAVGSGATAGGAASGMSDATVQNLIAQLHEQGIVTSKEQLVASLTQLLAQLLVTS